MKTVAACSLGAIVPVGEWEVRELYDILLGVPTPALTAEGMLPVGRFPCTLDEFEETFIDAATFVKSATRGEIFKDFLSVVGLLKAFSPDLVECVWIGGSFVTDKLDPDDIDCLFVLSGPAFDALPSQNKRNKIQAFNKKNYVRDKFALRVESFLLIRVPFANPWEKGGVHPNAAPYTQVRGAWDDWWLRTRTGEGPNDLPRIESAEPKRGYLEVIL